mgnify:CR=1 FL=1
MEQLKLANLFNHILLLFSFLSLYTLLYKFVSCFICLILFVQKNKSLFFREIKKIPHYSDKNSYNEIKYYVIILDQLLKKVNKKWKAYEMILNNFLFESKKTQFLIIITLNESLLWLFLWFLSISSSIKLLFTHMFVEYPHHM